MKNVILILGILTTVMVCGVVAGVSDDWGKSDLDMTEVAPEKCLDCHDKTGEPSLRSVHPSAHENSNCITCHYSYQSGDGDENMELTFCADEVLGCHHPNHHDFEEIFGDSDDWDCFTCHTAGVPR